MLQDIEHGNCNRLNVWIFPKFMLKPNPQCDGSGRVGSGRHLGQRWSHHEGMSTLTKETQRASLLLLSVYELGQRPSSDTEFAGILILDFLELGEINLCCISLWGPWNPKD